MSLITRRILPVFLAIASASPVYAAHSHGQPTPLGTFKDWSAYTAGSAAAKVCYALAQPQSSDPAKAHRGAIFFLISDWPGRKTKAEAEVVPGYPYMKDSVTTAQVGSDKFNFFTKNDGSGTAWVQAKSDESRLIEAMKRATQIIVTGTSARGTVTHDTYSLAGLADALAKAHAECRM